MAVATIYGPIYMSDENLLCQLFLVQKPVQCINIACDCRRKMTRISYELVSQSDSSTRRSKLTWWLRDCLMMKSLRMVCIDKVEVDARIRYLLGLLQEFFIIIYFERKSSSLLVRIWVLRLMWHISHIGGQYHWIILFGNQYIQLMCKTLITAGCKKVGSSFGQSSNRRFGQ